MPVYHYAGEPLTYLLLSQNGSAEPFCDANLCQRRQRFSTIGRNLANEGSNDDSKWTKFDTNHNGSNPGLKHLQIYVGLYSEQKSKAPTTYNDIHVA